MFTAVKKLCCESQHRMVEADQQRVEERCSAVKSTVRLERTEVRMLA